MKDTMWTVDVFVNCVREKKISEAVRIHWGKEVYPHRFETRDKAVAFLLGRAEQQVVEAQQEVAKSQKRLNALRKKFQAQTERAEVAEGSPRSKTGMDPMAGRHILEARQLIRDAMFWISGDSCGIVGGSWHIAARKWLESTDSKGTEKK